MPLTVFLVEDNPAIRDVLIPALRDLGQSDVLASAESQGEAIDWLASHKGCWNLAIVDFYLKEGSGLGVVQWCKERDRGQHVVVLTNSATPARRSACEQAGADAVFDKANELEEFFDYCLELAEQSQ